MGREHRPCDLPNHQLDDRVAGVSVPHTDLVRSIGTDGESDAAHLLEVGHHALGEHQQQLSPHRLDGGRVERPLRVDCRLPSTSVHIELVLPERGHSVLEHEITAQGLRWRSMLATLHPSHWRGQLFEVIEQVRVVGGAQVVQREGGVDVHIRRLQAILEAEHVAQRAGHDLGRRVGREVLAGSIFVGPLPEAPDDVGRFECLGGQSVRSPPEHQSVVGFLELLCLSATARREAEVNSLALVLSVETAHTATAAAVSLRVLQYSIALVLEAWRPTSTTGHVEGGQESYPIALLVHLVDDKVETTLVVFVLGKGNYC